MNLTISYDNGKSSGLVIIEVNADASMKDLLSAFHKESGVSDFYTIKGGAPPNRRSISVPYNYVINQKRISNKDLDRKVSEWGIRVGDAVFLEVMKSGKVD